MWDVRRCQMWEDLRRCEKMSDVRRCQKMSDVRRCQMWEDVRCEKMWEDVRRCEKMSDVRRCQMWEDVRRYEKISHVRRSFICRSIYTSFFLKNPSLRRSREKLQFSSLNFSQCFVLCWSGRSCWPARKSWYTLIMTVLRTLLWVVEPLALTPLRSLQPAYN